MLCLLTLFDIQYVLYRFLLSSFSEFHCVRKGGKLQQKYKCYIYKQMALTEQHDRLMDQHDQFSVA